MHQKLYRTNLIDEQRAFFQLVPMYKMGSHHIAISLYLLLEFNNSRWKEIITIYRSRILQHAKVGKDKYYSCMAEFRQWSFYELVPSRAGTEIKMISLPSELARPDQYDIVRSNAPSSPLQRTNEVLHVVHHNNNCNNLTSNKPKTDKFAKGKERDNHSSDVRVAGQQMPPSFSEITEFFITRGVHANEASNFYQWNSERGWNGLKHNTWKSLAEKWIGRQTSVISDRDIEEEIAALQNDLVKGRNPWTKVKSDHFDHLNLSLSYKSLKVARKHRIDQLSGDNNGAEKGHLWQDYKNNVQTLRVEADSENLKSIAKKLEVIAYLTNKITLER